jgi:hypothetical protein
MIGRRETGEAGGFMGNQYLARWTVNRYNVNVFYIM